MIEQPFSGRANITDNISEIELIIPAKKNYSLISIMILWLFGWVFGAIMAGKTFINPEHSGPPILFMTIWMTGWTLGGLGVIYFLVWSLFGKEIITIGNGLLTISKKGAMFSKAKSYELGFISNMLAKELPLYSQSRNTLMSILNRGTICFEYGMKTIRFGDALDEAEARHIIELLRTRKFIHGVPIGSK